MRSGYCRLAAIAFGQLNIDVAKGEDFVVFVSRTNKVCKMIWADECGTNLLTRHLHCGRFEQFLARIQDAALKTLTFEDLCAFLDGRKIMVKRQRIYE
jgi:hypothetical protein